MECRREIFSGEHQHPLVGLFTLGSGPQRHLLDLLHLASVTALASGLGREGRDSSTVERVCRGKHGGL
jgi:hypothetical protein